MLVVSPLSGMTVSKLIRPMLISLQLSLLASVTVLSLVKDLNPNSIIYVPCPLIFWGLTLTTVIHAQAVFWKFSHFHKLGFPQTLGLSLLE